jgi:dTDP-glucose pyrophosphorylase
LNILIPMAGRGQRFLDQHYAFPKPLISVDGKPMIEAVVESLNVRGRFIFLVLAEHLRTYALPELLRRAVRPDEAVIVPVHQITEGAACTALLAKDYIDSDEPLLIANSDQLVEWEPEHFVETAEDGCIATFTATHPKWSYVRLDAAGYVAEVAEKRPISDHATCGIYYFAHGSSFVWGAERMIATDKRVNGEFYIAPVYNELIEMGARITTYEVEAMHGLGTPEDLEEYKRRKALRRRKVRREPQPEMETTAVQPELEKR